MGVALATLQWPPSTSLSGVRLSVRLSRWWIYRQTSCSPGSIITVVFWSYAPIPNSKENPFSEGAKFTGVGKISDFRLKSPIVSEIFSFQWGLSIDTVFIRKHIQEPSAETPEYKDGVIHFFMD